jgi:hypothetical protein
MKAFDLIAAISGKPLQKLNGEKVTFVTYLPQAEEYNRVVVLDSKNEVLAYSEKGIYSIWGDIGPISLRMAPEKKTFWVNFYAENDAYYYDSQEEADLAASHVRLGGKAYPVEVEL